MNTFGTRFRLTTFGESHGAAVGGVIDGFPSGIAVDLDFIQAELDRRRPGQSLLTTARKEGDKVEILSGVFEGKSTGCPIGFIVRNENQHSSDYDNLRTLFRPRMPISPISRNTECATIAEVGVRQHAKRFRASWVALSQNSFLRSWA